MTTILTYHFELIIIALSIVILTALLWRSRREVGRLTQEIIRLRWIVVHQGDELARKQGVVDSQAELIREQQDGLELHRRLNSLQREYIDKTEAELARRAVEFANLSVRYADAVYAAKDARLAAAVRRYGRGNVEYAYIGLDERAADAGHDFIYRN